jgi:hypothetical protein
VRLWAQRRSPYGRPFPWLRQTPIDPCPTSTRLPKRAIFSGGATLGADRRLRVFHTSIGHPSPEQWIALPKDEDLVRWDRPALNPVLAIGAHGSLTVFQWRDPFLFKEGRDTYTTCRGNVDAGRGGGCALLEGASNR